MFRNLLLCALSCLALEILGCSSGNGEDHENAQAGFVWLSAQGNIVALGSNDTTAPVEARPRMYSRLSADYQLSANEVTVGEFSQIMGYRPVGTEQDSAEWPVRFVTWTEAAVYCNRLSAELGLDTVYTWDSLIVDVNRRVQTAVGLGIRWEVFGVRLPTEAEWLYAAGSGVPADVAHYAWYGENSGGLPHAVSSLTATNGGFHDLFGNVMEWVSDNEVPYPEGDTVVDFVGGVGVAGSGERVLKGGSFLHGKDALSVLRRTDTYPLAGNERKEYIGFRTAIGVLEPSYMTSTGGKAQPFGVTAAMTASQLLQKLGHVDFRLAFVDYPSSRLALYRPSGFVLYPDSGPVFHPDISPDGKWIAYGTRYEGQQGSGSVWVRSTDSLDRPRVLVAQGHIPRWWISESGDTLLVFLESAGDNAASDWNASRTLAVVLHGGFPQGSPQVLEASGSWNGGVSNDGSWIASGYTHLLVKDRSTGNVDTLFRSPANGKPASASEQACNVSTSHDVSPRLLFLDFGANSSSVVGHGYGVHEVLFVSDLQGNILRTISVPPERESWDHSEWSSLPRYAVAVARDEAGVSRDVWLVDVDAGNYSRLLKGEEIWHPSLWVSSGIPPIDVNADSAGMYEEPPSGSLQNLFGYRLLEFWSRTGDQFYFLGNSQAADGLDPAVFPDSGYNMAFGGCDLRTQREMVDHYILPHGHARWIGISIGMEWLTRPEDEWTWTQGIDQSIGRLYDSVHGYWQSGPPDGWRALMASRPRPGIAMDVHDGGLFAFSSNGWGVASLDFPWNVGGAFHDPQLMKNLDTLEAMALRIQAKGIHCILMTMPVHPGYASLPYYSAAGLDDSIADSVITRLSAFASRNARIHFLNGNRNGAHGFSDAYAYDRLHLSVTGAARFTAILRDSLQSWGVESH